ncbi:MAG: outer membrane protein assembly factor BamD, partial [Terriglobales bacterium]
MPALLLTALFVAGNSGCLLLHRSPVANPLSNVKSQQPDKLLYDIAMKDISQGKYTVARLNLQTLLNTYPNSEYLAQAKLAVANSWYLQGGTEGYAQAEAQYKDFITFFPAMQEASEAQLRIAQIHFKQLQKPDRDPTQALEAQAALRTFLLNYPDSPLRPQALQMLRVTQEVLAQRIYLIGQYYLDRAHQGAYSDYRAAQSRLKETQVQFPLYSQGDVIADELGQSYATTSKLYQDASTLERNKTDHELYVANAEADRANAVKQFQHLIERYPTSPLAKDAGDELKALHASVPDPSAAAIAFNRKEIAGRQKAPNPHGWSEWLGVKSIWTGRPATQLALADKVGTPPFTEVPDPPTPPLPGLQELIHQTMVASGAIPATTPAQITAAMTEAGKIHEAGEAADHTVTASASAKPAPLAFQSVPTESSRGADTLPTNTPQATTGSNYGDPNATAAAPAVDPSVVLTPDEIDMENRDEMLAAGSHRDVPAPLKE